MEPTSLTVKDFGRKKGLPRYLVGYYLGLQSNVVGLHMKKII